MSPIPKAIVEKFCRACNWVYQAWLIQKVLFEESPGAEALKRNTDCGYLLESLNVITQEYALQQMAKLHDPAQQGHNKNLSLDCIIRQTGWEPTTETRLADLKKKLDDLAAPILVARNKVLSHNDLETHVEGRVHGAFEAGNDYLYFELLREFACLIHQEVIGTVFVFDELLRNDADCFIAALCKAKVSQASNF